MCVVAAAASNVSPLYLHIATTTRLSLPLKKGYLAKGGGGGVEGNIGGIKENCINLLPFLHTLFECNATFLV